MLPILDIALLAVGVVDVVGLGPPTMGSATRASEPLKPGIHGLLDSGILKLQAFESVSFLIQVQH